MNEKFEKSPALFTPSGCLTSEALMLIATGSVQGLDLANAQKHISECPLCTDAAEGLHLWLKENKPSNASTVYPTPVFNSEKSELSDTKTHVPSHRTKLAGPHTNLFHERTIVINERIKQRLHKHVTYEMEENKRISFRPFVWIAAAAIAIILIGSYFVVWIQNQYDSQKLATQRTNELAMLEKLSTSDTITITVPEYKVVHPMKGEAVTFGHEYGIAEDSEIFNQDELAATPLANTVSEALLSEQELNVEEKAAIDEETKTVFAIVEEMPSFPGGDAERNKFLAQNIQYPEQARESGIQGTVYISFIINPSGKIEDAKILRGIGGGCDEEALRVVKLMPPWKPGRQNGKTVRTLFNMPVYFKLR
ncbi:MAG: energy transducer TonB [Bacteroidales bacterium]